MRYLDVVGYLLGHDSPLDRLDAAGARDAVVVTLTEMVRRHAETRMTVLVVDNLQWADPSLRDHLGVIVRSLSDLPFLLVTAQRPGDLGWPPAVERPLVLQVPLGPLGDEESAELVAGIFANAGMEPTTRTLATVVERGGGNPLFLVELATLSARCDNELPGSLRALIAARLDQLPAPQRAIVDNAAVLGTADSVGGLKRFAEAMGQDFRQRDLDELAADGLLDVDGRWWRFRSAVVREVAYQTLTKRVRAQRHAGVAAVIAERGASIDDVAHHAATAAELLAELGQVDGVSPSITGHAVQALLEAATAAVETGRLTTAIRARRAAASISTRPTPRSSGPCSSCAPRRSWSGASSPRRRPTRRRCWQARWPTATRSTRARPDGGSAASPSCRVTWRRRGRELGAAVDLFRAAGDEPRLANALRARGFAEVFGGSLDDARWLLGEAMDLYHGLDEERGHAWTHQNLAWVAFQSGDFADAERQLAEARVRFEGLGDANGVIWADGLRAWVRTSSAVTTRPRRWRSPSRPMPTGWADSWASLMMTTLLANLRLWHGRLAEAEQLAERALAGFREIGDRYGVMQALGPLNRARAALGKKADAKRGVEEAVSLGKQFGELGLALQGGAGVAMHLGAGEQALTLAEQVIERNEVTGANTSEASVLLALAEAQVGRLEDALAVIEQVPSTTSRSGWRRGRSCAPPPAIPPRRSATPTSWR